MIWRLLKDPADVVQAVRSADQGLKRLVGQGGEMGVACRDVGRVRGNHIEAPAHTLKPRTLQEMHRQSQALGIG